MCKLEAQDTSWRSFSGYYYMGADSTVVHPEVRMTVNHDIGGMANKLVIGGEYRYHVILFIQAGNISTTPTPMKKKAFGF